MLKYSFMTQKCIVISRKVPIQHQIGFDLIVPQFSPTAQISEQVLLMIIHRSVLLFLTLLLPAMGGISLYMSVTWQQPVGIGLKVWTVKTVQVIWCVNWVSTNCFCPKKNYKTETSTFSCRVTRECKTFNFCCSLWEKTYQKH